MKKIHSNQNGFTLVEMMFAAALSIIVAGSFFAAIRGHDAQWDEIYIKMNLEEQGMRALNKMEQELRMTAPSRVLQSGGAAMVDGTSYSAIQFQVPNESSPIVASSGAVNWSGAHTIVYSVSGTQLIRTDSNATVETTTRKLCNFISSVSFTPSNSKSTVKITLNLQESTRWNRTITQTISVNCQVRNP